MLYYAFPVARAEDRRRHRLVVAAVTAAFSTGLVVSALVGVPVGRLARPGRSTAGDDDGVGAGGPGRAGIAVAPRRCRSSPRGSWPAWPCRHALPGVRGADPLVGTTPSRRADRPDPARRPGQHDLRAADRRPARPPGVAAHLPRPRHHARRDHDSLRTCRAARTLARPRSPTGHPSIVDGRTGSVARSRAFLSWSRRSPRRVHRLRGRGEPGAAADRAACPRPGRRGRWASAGSARSSAASATGASPRPHRPHPQCRRSSRPPQRPRPARGSFRDQPHAPRRRRHLAGAARGVYTLLQATAVTDRWGATHYGRLNGCCPPPPFAAALAPWAGAALARPSAAIPPCSASWPDWRPRRGPCHRLDPSAPAQIVNRPQRHPPGNVCQVPAVSPASSCFIGASPCTSTPHLVAPARRVPR